MEQQITNNENIENNDIQEVENTISRNPQIDPILKQEPITEDDLNKDDPDNNKLDKINQSIVFPNAMFSTYEDYTKELNNVRESLEDFTKSLTKLQSFCFYNNFNAPRSTTRRDVFGSMNNHKEDFTNEVDYGDKKLVTRPINMQVKDKLNSSSAIARFTALLGVGEVVQVPLWHSGFWVTLKPMKQKDFINLYTALNSASIELGRSTTSLVFSNYSVVIVRIIMDFILDCITDTTINLKESEDIRKYIKIQDINPLINGLLATMYPKGISILKTCNNSLIMTDQNQPKCDYTIRADLDNKKLLWVDRKSLNDKLLDQMSKRLSKSVSVDSCIEYQRELEATTALKDKTVIIPINNGESNIEITLSTPSILKHIERGEAWVNDIIKTVEKIVTEDSKVNKEDKLQEFITISRANAYNSYIKSIKDSDGYVFKTDEEIEKVLDLISYDNDTYDAILKEITKFTDNAVIAIIATPDFTCPKCKASQIDENDKNPDDPFKEFIPLNVLEYFFDLCELRKNKINNQNIF